ncbi:MAG: tetraacyldisaccharide 4'-kinase [Flavobacteriaceae bacterium]|nr:tetraacyldisaccharide 4'-kinase [Flavobacteriaceae bacterium]
MKRWYLYPFSLVYHLITALRNRMYDWGILKSTRFRTPIIGVGNLSVGGSGKSPLVMYLAELLSEYGRTGVLSRGYGRKTKGYYVVNYDSNHLMVGDEAIQLFQRFKNKFVIGVCENRVFGAKKLITDMDLRVLILDDSYQHRAIKAGLNILLTDFNAPYFQDFLLPAGDLRESRRGAKRANIIIITKCPENLSQEVRQKYIDKIKPKHYQKIFFSYINYEGFLLSKSKKLPIENLIYYDVLLLTGIANPAPMLQELSKHISKGKIKHLSYKDHHNFDAQDVKKIAEEYRKLGQYKIILTTEKDFARLMGFDYFSDKLFYWPINIDLENKEVFNQIILDYVRKN